jgi:hypothetical protein
MRYVVLFLLGLAIGAAFAVIAANRINEGQAYPHGVMAVLRAQSAALYR